MQLESIFKSTATSSSDDVVLINTLWQEVQTYYNHRKRYYHNLIHIENIINELSPIKDHFYDWDVLLFSVFYHDIIYKSTKKDNEERSAELALKRLKSVNISDERANRCFNQIIATKSHINTGDLDTDLFTDADLSILGKDWDVYQLYCQNIRKEYKIYPKAIYNPARKKALSHFLEMPSIFKTDYFKKRYEKQARLNISKEIKQL